MPNNKIRYNLKNVHAAKQTEDAEGKYIWIKKGNDCVRYSTVKEAGQFEFDRF